MLDGVLVHPLANLFPMMDEQSYEALKADIRENGQQEHIVFWRGYLLDGRNRWRACEELGIAKRICDVSADDNPLSVVLSLNAHRRHLTNAQRAMVAARLSNLKVGRPSAKWQGDLSVEEAAKLMKASPRMVSRAKFVLDKGVPALWRKVDEGKMSLTHAERIAR